MADTLTLSDFLVARIDEQEAAYRKALGYCLSVDDHRTAKLLGLALRDCEAKRRIVEFHKSWPVLVETPPTLEAAYPSDPNSMTYRMSQQVAWMTEQQYRERFGSEPPTAPVLRALASVYADHAHFRQEWAGE